MSILEQSMAESLGLETVRRAFAAHSEQASGLGSWALEVGTGRLICASRPRGSTPSNPKVVEAFLALDHEALARGTLLVEGPEEQPSASPPSAPGATDG